VKVLRVVITLVSLWSVLWHAHVGCCAHHEHALADGCGAVAVCAMHEHSDGQPRDHSAPPAERDAPPAHDDCHETHCHAVVAANVIVPPCDGLAGWIAPVVLGDELTRGASYAERAYLASDELCPLALRAHLRFVVLLI
jgi:hypothetical protein